MAPNRLTEVLMSVDIHRESAMLSFTIALSLSDRTKYPGTERCRYEIVQIWRVALVLNESQDVIGLSAEQIACFPHKFVVSTTIALSLLGSTIAFNALMPDDGIPPCTLVVDWVYANANPSTYSWKVLNDVEYTVSILGILLNYICYIFLMTVQSRIHLLPGNNLLIVELGRIDLLNYSTVQPTTSIAPRGQNHPFLDYVWRAPVKGLFSHALSTCFLSADSTRLIFVAYESLYSMIVENTASPSVSVPSRVMLMDVTFFLTGIGPSPALGYNHGVFVDQRHDAWLMRYTSPSAGSTFEEPALTRKHITSIFPSSALH